VINLKIYKLSAVIFAFTAFLIFFIFIYLIHINFFTPGTPNNGSDLLSTVAQIQASIIAIIVSLTLVAVQLASQRYSPRILSIFINKKKDFWILILIYSISIFYDVMVLWIINNFKYLGLLSILIYVGILLLIIALTFLFIYIKSAIEFLEPANAINMIIEDIKPIKIDEYINDEAEQSTDPLIVILDIINSALLSNDENTIITGVEGITKIFKNCLDYMDNIYKLEESKKLTEINSDEFDKYMDIDKRNKKKIDKFDNMPTYFGDLVTDITINCIKKRLKFASIKSINSFEIMFNNIAEIENENKNSAFNLIYHMYIIDKEMLKFLEKEGYKEDIADPKLREFIQSPIKCLGKMSIEAIQNKLDTTYYTADYEIDILKEITETSIDKGQEFLTYSDIYMRYENDRFFAGPARLRIALVIFFEINQHIMKILPNLNDDNDLDKWKNGKYVIEESFLNKYRIIVKSLEKYINVAIENRWDGVANEGINSLNSNLNELLEKKYDLVERVFIFELAGILKRLNKTKSLLTV
jgi:hypothetical protein